MSESAADFLRRSLAEVRARAEAAAEYPGRRWAATNGAVFDDDGAEPLMSFCNEVSEAALAAYIASWDPATALRMVAGAEKLLELHGFYLAGGRREAMCNTCGGEGVMDAVSWPCPTLLIEAERWGWASDE